MTMIEYVHQILMQNSVEGLVEYLIERSEGITGETSCRNGSTKSWNFAGDFDYEQAPLSNG